MNVCVRSFESPPLYGCLEHSPLSCELNACYGLGAQNDSLHVEQYRRLGYKEEEIPEESSASSAEALVSLAVLAMNTKDGETNNWPEAMSYLQKAHQMNPHHPVVLNFLADHMFFLGDAPRSRELAQEALRNTSNPTIEGVSHYLVARTFHLEVCVLQMHTSLEQGHHRAVPLTIRISCV